MGAGATKTEVPSVSSELLNNATQQVLAILYARHTSDADTRDKIRDMQEVNFSFRND